MRMTRRTRGMRIMGDTDEKVEKEQMVEKDEKKEDDEIG